MSSLVREPDSSLFLDWDLDLDWADLTTSIVITKDSLNVVWRIQSYD